MNNFLELGANVRPAPRTRLDELFEAGSVANILPPDCFSSERGLTRRGVALAAVGASTVLSPIVDNLTHSKVVSAQEQAPNPRPMLYFVGDSISVGRGSAGFIPELTNQGLDVIGFEAVGGRQIVLAGCEPAYFQPVVCAKYRDGIRQLDQDKDKVGIADGVVISLNTNGRINDVRENTLRIGRQAHLYGVAPDNAAPIIIFPEIFGESSYANANPKNDEMRAAVAELQAEGIKAVLVPYKEFVDNSLRPNGGMQPDEVHPNGQGYKELVRHDAEVIPPLVFEHYYKLHHLPATPPAASPTPAPAPEPAPTPAPVLPIPRDVIVAPVPAPAPPPPHKIMVSPGVANLSMPAGLQSTVAPTPRLRPLNEQLFSSPPVDLRYRPQTVTSPEPAPLPVEPSPPPVVSAPTSSEPPRPYDLSYNPSSEISPQPVTLITIHEVIGADAPATTVVAPEPSPPPVTPAPPVVSSPEAPASTSPDRLALLETAEQNSIFYDPGTKRAMQYLRSFYNPSQVGEPVINEGFGDRRNLPQTGPYIHPNSDWDTPPGKATEFVSPGWFVVHRFDDPNPGQKKGVGNALFLETGPDAETGRLLGFQATHFSKINVQDGEVVSPGQLLSLAGDTGIATGPHFSVGVTDHETSPYTSFDESKNPFNYFFPNYTCSPDAMDDPGEVCGPTTPDGRVLPVPVPLAALEFLGLPEYLTDEPLSVPGETPSPGAGQGPADLRISRADIPTVPAGLPSLSTIVTEGPIVSVPSDEIDTDPGADEEDNNRGRDNERSRGDRPSLLRDLEDEIGSFDPPPQAPPDVPPDPGSFDPPAPEPEPEPTDDGTPIDLELPPSEEPPTEEPPGEETPPMEEQPDPTEAPPAPGSSIPETIYNFFIDNGYTHAGAVGIMANMKSESGFQPTRTQISWKGNCAAAPERLDPDTGKHHGGTRDFGFGLAQWTIESRQEGLQAYADHKGTHWTDLTTQLEYWVIEMQATQYFGDLDTVLRTTEDIEHATTEVLMRFEQPLSVIRGNDPTETINERNRAAWGLHEAIVASQLAMVDVACDGIGPD